MAEICCSEATSNSSGSAPNRSWSESWVACSWEKLPEIDASPPGEGSCTSGAEMTIPSSTMPKAAVAPSPLYRAPVMVEKDSAAVSSKDMFTT